ncbi:biotin/lipoate A/B protein ligase family protein [Arcobacter sp. LA11]|uniref:lipoate--protein ligase family protein n=1 Tax=Arcobacter sp. LA11 TaxID=1898176 RepID=UPI000A49BB1D|nr:biotin/lipoate A/B protein ligase family protein [Arcobacter sp. LA11]
MIDKKSKFRVIITEQKSAKENMAIDDALLSSYKNEDLAILRLYTWNKDSLTIGVSQNFSNYAFIEKPDEIGAKRITGGGILFHGHDLSYSLVIPTEFLKDYNIKKSYETICSFILKFYGKLGLNVCYAKDNENIQLSKSEYCQVGFEAYDILVNGKKIGGNAQRRTKKAIFQHGSIPIFKTKDDEKFGNSLEDVNINTTFEEAIKLLIASFEDSFNVEIEYSNLTKEEEEKKVLLLKDKYDYASK